MRSNGARLALAVATIAAAVILFIVLSGDDDNDSNSSNTTTTSTADGGAQTQSQTQTTTIEVPPPDVIVVRDGKPQGGVQELEYTKGERVRFVVRSDVADEVHVHGYDLSEEVSAGGSVRFSFPADIEGVFEIELHESEEQIAELRVSPS